MKKRAGGWILIMVLATGCKKTTEEKAAQQEVLHMHNEMTQYVSHLQSAPQKAQEAVDQMNAAIKQTEQAYREVDTQQR